MTAEITHAPIKARRPKLLLKVAIALMLATGTATMAGLTAYAAEPPDLGTAANFTILGGAGVTCTDSTVTGDVGSVLTVTQTPTCSITGAINEGDAIAVQAFDDFGVAYDMVAAQQCEVDLTGQQLGGMTLTPNVYCFDTTADLTTGTLTLDGPADGIWIFQIGTGLTTGTANVVMANGAQPCNVYWLTGTTATIGNGTEFLGNILAGSAATFTGASSSLVGRALANTAVTMTGADISACG